MIKITKAKESEHLDDEWDLLDVAHYGKRIIWEEKKFRFKAVEDGKLLGTIEGKYESGVVYIAAVITASESRGRGIGTMLIKKAEEFGREYGAHQTCLVTGKEWSENIFYKKLGFKKAGNLTDFYFHTDFVIYTRPIE